MLATALLIAAVLLLLKSVKSGLDGKLLAKGLLICPPLLYEFNILLPNQLLLVFGFGVVDEAVLLISSCAEVRLSLFEKNSFRHENLAALDHALLSIVLIRYQVLDQIIKCIRQHL